MIDSVIKVIIFIVMMALGGYFIVLFYRRHGSVLMGYSAARSSDKNSDQQIEILQKLPIGSRQFLAVVKFGEQKFLIGVSPVRIDAIGEISADCKHKGTSFRRDHSDDVYTNSDLLSMKIKN